MTENNDDKELQNALAIIEDGETLDQLKEQLSSVQNQYDVNLLATAGKETKGLKLYDKLVHAMDDCFLKVLSNSDIDDDFHRLLAITTYKHEYEHELHHLNQYWPAWCDTLLSYGYFLIQQEFGMGGYTYIHVTFERWLKKTMNENSTPYTLAKAYNIWEHTRMATIDYSEVDA